MSKSPIKIGVLAIQGDFAAHSRMLKRLGVEVVEVRCAEQLEGVDGLILPGGESTTMLKFLTGENLLEPIRQFALAGKPVLGTCAGAILVAREVLNPPQASLDLLNLTLERNGYGRQVDSHIAEADTKLEGGTIEAVFIRAPRIKAYGPEIEVLATVAGEAVFVREGNIYAATFHPELTNDERVHRLFVNHAMACKS